MMWGRQAGTDHRVLVVGTVVKAVKAVNHTDSVQANFAGGK
jgi:hypothetical protein